MTLLIDKAKDLKYMCKITPLADSHFHERDHLFDLRALYTAFEYIMNESGALFGRFGNIFSVSNQQLKGETYII